MTELLDWNNLSFSKILYLDNSEKLNQKNCKSL